MSIDCKKHDGICYLAVTDEMTIYTAAEQKQKLLGYLDECNEIELDLAGVSEIDSAGLQVLMLLKNESQRVDKDVRIVQHSQPVIEVLEILNLATRFGDPIVIPTEWQTP